ncbi:uncharacterized protein RHIMIDRAFT_233424 [Rhizopus microsporus ATCC 52813]|uniref:SGNH hydrolase n=1 Tax=Rhizopus microsporus ATCC 52813 TaxID=1340429 RepID=A0A2G4TAH7_RHIZD|nr:uncharacterized protein RHIMIDRAFT_233424 [Rhizopus microsporus ATCC 52813]PHZ18005.1 hypothetical protein RHIMIDRAFT_233424 [Rhizopus microsporus ATCC 52813]
MQYLFIVTFTILISTLAFNDAYQYAERIEDCPRLQPRARPTSVRDLRADDIKVVGALGDSIMAGAVSKGLEGSRTLNINIALEDRGITYGAGGNPGAITIPNFIKHYSPNVIGGSVGDHWVEFCYFGLCPKWQYHPEKDRFNAAQSAAMSFDLGMELDYLIPAMRKTLGLDFENDWKMITIQIGSVDQCYICSVYGPLLTPEGYEKSLNSALRRIRKEVPRVLVNLIGVFNVTNVYELTTGNPYCSATIFGDFQTNSLECFCATHGFKKEVDIAAAAYDSIVFKLAKKYNEFNDPTFGIMYTPANVDLASLPVQIDGDCFHPSVIGHGTFAKTYWNTFWKPLESIPNIYTVNDYNRVVCPGEEDRFQLKAL